MPFAERRKRLEEVLADATAPIVVTPLTRDREVATDWFQRFEGAGFDGYTEVEIMSAQNWWKRDPDEVVSVCLERMQTVV